MRIFLPKGNFSLLSYCCSQQFSYISENTSSQGVVKELAHKRLTVLFPETYFRWCAICHRCDGFLRRDLFILPHLYLTVYPHPSSIFSRNDSALSRRSRWLYPRRRCFEVYG